MSELTELVKQAANGDREAFGELYEQTKNGVWFTCVSLLKNEENAKDTLQDTYLVAFERLGTIEKPEAVQSWLNKIAANKCKNFISAKCNSAVENSEELLENIPDDGIIPEKYVEDKAQRELIMRIIKDALSEEQFRTVILYYFDELTAPEIAELLGVHEKTVLYRLKTARGKIAEAISRYEDEHGDKLHAAAPLLPLSRLLQTESKGISAPNSPESFYGSPLHPAGSAEKTGGKAMLNSLKAKIIAGACAAVVVGGGAAAGVVIANNAKDKPDNRPAYSAPMNTSRPTTVSNSSKPESTSKPAAISPSSDDAGAPRFEGMKAMELLRSTGEFGEYDPDILSGHIKDAYFHKNNLILLTDDGELWLYNYTYGGYVPICFGKDTGITKLDNMLFKTNNVTHSLTVVDGNRVFFKSINADGEVNLSTNEGNERAAQGVLFEGRAMREIVVGMYIEELYAIDEDGNGFELTNRYMFPMEFTNDKYVYADTCECFMYYPATVNSFIYNGMKLKQRAGNCIIAEDGKLYFHRSGSGNADEAPIGELADIDFERVYNSRAYVMFDERYYAGVTADGRIMAIKVTEDDDNVAHGEIAFSDSKPDGELQNIWLNSNRIVVKTDKGCFYAKYGEDDAFKPLDALNAIDEEAVYIGGDNVVLLSNGYLYTIDALKK